jgi:hypothetical protein
LLRFQLRRASAARLARRGSSRPLRRFRFLRKRSAIKEQRWLI